MIGTFAAELEHFAHSVDIVDDAKFDRVRQLVYQYIGREFKDVYFELLREVVINEGHREIWLKTFWSSTDREHLWRTRDDSGAHTNAVTASFDRDRPLWLVSDDRTRPALAGARLQDEWSSLHLTPGQLPPYNPSSPDAKTAIVIPLPRSRVLGAVCIESSRQTRRTDVASAELMRLCNAISILFELYDVNQTQSRCTGTAIEDLSRLITRSRFPKTALPHAFVAFPKSADSQVTAAIRGVLEEYSEKLEATNWDRIYASGSIPTQLAREIDESVLGICYLSEPVPPQDRAPNASHAYRDNANVIFEAGMLHNRTATHAEDMDGQPRGWIPIREPEPSSPPPPFDFAAERILIVPRNTAGDLLQDTFKELLRQHLDMLLSQH